jgi:hypothetical protein
MSEGVGGYTLTSTGQKVSGANPYDGVYAYQFTSPPPSAITPQTAGAKLTPATTATKMGGAPAMPMKAEAPPASANMGMGMKGLRGTGRRPVDLQPTAGHAGGGGIATAPAPASNSIAPSNPTLHPATTAGRMTAMPSKAVNPRTGKNEEALAYTSEDSPAAGGFTENGVKDERPASIGQRLKRDFLHISFAYNSIAAGDQVSMMKAHIFIADPRAKCNQQVRKSLVSVKGEKAENVTSLFTGADTQTSHKMLTAIQRRFKTGAVGHWSDSKNLAVEEITMHQASVPIKSGGLALTIMGLDNPDTSDMASNPVNAITLGDGSRCAHIIFPFPYIAQMRPVPLYIRADDKTSNLTLATIIKAQEGTDQRSSHVGDFHRIPVTSGLFVYALNNFSSLYNQKDSLQKALLEFEDEERVPMRMGKKIQRTLEIIRAKLQSHETFVFVDNGKLFQVPNWFKAKLDEMVNNDKTQVNTFDSSMFNITLMGLDGTKTHQGDLLLMMKTARFHGFYGIQRLDDGGMYEAQEEESESDEGEESESDEGEGDV